MQLFNWILFILFIWWMSTLVGGFGKYEGLNAEEWFNAYDESEAKYQELHDCVEPYAMKTGYVSANDLYYECF